MCVFCCLFLGFVLVFKDAFFLILLPWTSTLCKSMFCKPVIMLNGHTINSAIFSLKSGNQRGRPKAFSLKRNTKFAIAPFSLEASFSFITLSYLQYNKIPTFMTKEMAF